MADRLTMTNPLVIGDRTLMAGLAAEMKKDPHRYDLLGKTDFKLKKDVTTSDFLYREGGKYYMDTGMTDAIVDGRVGANLDQCDHRAYEEQVKVISSAVPQAYSEKGIIFSDGTEVETDLVVFATGFVKGMRGIVEMLGQEITASLPDIGGFGPDGETRGSWRKARTAKREYSSVLVNGLFLTLS